MKNYSTTEETDAQYINTVNRSKLHEKNTWDKSKSATKKINMKPQDFIKSQDDRRFYKKLFALNNEIR